MKRILHPNKIKYLRLASCTAYTVYHLAVLHHNERRNAHYTKLSCKVGIIVYIYLSYEKILALACNLINDGKHHAAGTAPIRVKIKKGKSLVISYSLEIIFIKSYC